MGSRSVLITGAGSGIGLGLTHHMAAAGFPVIAADLDELALVEAVADIEGGEVSCHRLDVTRQADIDALLVSLGDRPVEILVNNAGLQHVARLEDFPPEKWQLLVEVMLIGAAMMTRALLPRMRANGYGRIVNIGSIHGLVASRFKSAYIAAKHGLLGFSKVVALETADADITINTICPSYVKTPLVEKQIAAQAKEHGISEERVVQDIMLAPMPKGCFISIEELAGITQFLVSDSARNITGQTIVVDGGWTVQ